MPAIVLTLFLDMNYGWKQCGIDIIINKIIDSLLQGCYVYVKKKLRRFPFYDDAKTRLLNKRLAFVASATFFLLLLSFMPNNIA